MFGACKWGSGQNVDGNGSWDQNILFLSFVQTLEFVLCWLGNQVVERQTKGDDKKYRFYILFSPSWRFLPEPSRDKKNKKWKYWYRVKANKADGSFERGSVVAYK